MVIIDDSSRPVDKGKEHQPKERPFCDGDRTWPHEKPHDQYKGGYCKTENPSPSHLEDRYCSRGDDGEHYKEGCYLDGLPGHHYLLPNHLQSFAADKKENGQGSAKS